MGTWAVGCMCLSGKNSCQLKTTIVVRNFKRRRRIAYSQWKNNIHPEQQVLMLSAYNVQTFDTQSFAVLPHVRSFS